MRKIISILLIGLFPFCAHAQITTVDQANAIFTKKISIGLDLGFPILNYNQPLKKIMKDQAFDEPTACLFFCTGTIEHPHSSTAAYLGIDLSYLLRYNREVGLRTSIFNGGETLGYHDRYRFLFVQYKKLSFTPYYRFTNLRRKFQLDIGIAANFVKFSRTDHDRNPLPDNQYFRPGIMVGGNIGIIERTSSYLRLSAQMNVLLWKVQIGPYHSSFIEEGEIRTELSLREEPLQLRELLIFLSYGRKF